MATDVLSRLQTDEIIQRLAGWLLVYRALDFLLAMPDTAHKLDARL